MHFIQRNTQHTLEKYNDGIVELGEIGNWGTGMGECEWVGFEETEKEFQGFILSASWSKKSLQNMKLTSEQ